MIDRFAPLPMPMGYRERLTTLVRQGLLQIVRPPSHSLRAKAARNAAWRALWLSAFAAIGIAALMAWLDAAEIVWMPPRGAPSLWPLRILTDFGKPTYVIATLAVLLGALVLLTPRVSGVAYATLIGLAARLQFVLIAVVLGELSGEIIKGIVGRGRPFVGGQADVFTYSHFAWSEAYASFPSGHAITSCALAAAVGSLWPRLRVVMMVYVIAILVTRLVLLAHHPSDVLAGIFIGVISAILVRFWFAARRIVFIIRGDGSIVARPGPSGSAIAYALGRVAKR